MKSIDYINQQILFNFYRFSLLTGTFLVYERSWNSR